MHERLYRINQLLASRRVVPTNTFLAELEVSLATLKRDLAYLRDRLHAPIVFDRDLQGYRLDKGGGGPAFHLPGLWFDAHQTRALLTMRTLLQQLD
ncbi:helix-turn-helix transcriptional regulator, partial [Chitinimonas sp.]|uniref:helix-turn-helix transcriptional regulator n=1 Tax=Chitinimonas sp. TaxID=1934313 RepID=UPI0035B15F47